MTEDKGPNSSYSPIPHPQLFHLSKITWYVMTYVQSYILYTYSAYVLVELGCSLLAWLSCHLDSSYPSAQRSLVSSRHGNRSTDCLTGIYPFCYTNLAHKKTRCCNAHKNPHFRLPFQLLLIHVLQTNNNGLDQRWSE